ncbi:MAG: 3-hydroxyacyl-CoA dehydrogenase family protein, partial [Saprospiraceae bacterium]
NPASIMPLVEIIPAIQTNDSTSAKAKELAQNWGKTVVMAKDTPGFIVNRIARPFYGEAIRIYEEGIAEPHTIDAAMTSIGGFKMGPFALMDFIGHDVNYAVTESVFASFYFDPRYKPSFTQKRLVEAGYLGRKSGRGFYSYPDGPQSVIELDSKLAREIFERILAMLINEAADALFLGVASKEDIDLAMTKGTNYPQGLLAWADDLGISYVVSILHGLYAEYQEDRYRCSPLLQRMARNYEQFY